MSLVVREELVRSFKESELSGNELLALMAFGIVCLCQEEVATAEQLSKAVLGKFPLVEQEVALKAFELALDCVTDARFVAYCPSTARYRGTLAGKLIAAIGEDLAGSGGKIAVLRFIHWAEHTDEVSQELATSVKAKAAETKKKMEQVKEQLKAMLEKETIQ